MLEKTENKRKEAEDGPLKTIGCGNKAIYLDVVSHVTSFHQSECLILAYNSYAMLNLCMTSTPGKIIKTKI